MSDIKDEDIKSMLIQHTLYLQNSIFDKGKPLNLDGADISEKFLKGADLSYASLQHTIAFECNFKGASLNEANCHDINAQYANFTYASCVNAIFVKADLSGANLMNADFRGANLAYADLRNANIRGANFEGANLIGTLIDAHTVANDGMCITGYVRAGEHIVTVEISEAVARVTPLGTRTSRCKSVRVVNIDSLIINDDGSGFNKRQVVDPISKLVFRKGLITVSPKFNSDNRVISGDGIEFYITELEAQLA